MNIHIQHLKLKSKLKKKRQKNYPLIRVRVESREETNEIPLENLSN